LPLRVNIRAVVCHDRRAQHEEAEGRRRHGDRSISLSSMRSTGSSSAMTAFSALMGALPFQPLYRIDQRPAS
jgi:hypothetical protein